MPSGLHQAIHHNTHKGNATRSVLGFLDRSAYLMGGVTVAFNVPQLWAVWTANDISGVSLVSWAGFLAGSFFWLFYGILHKQRPIVVLNGSLIIVQGLIVYGLLRR